MLTKIKKHLPRLIDVAFIIGLIYALENGVVATIGFISFFAIILIYRFWKARELLYNQLLAAEVVLFGKTLEKGNWRGKKELWDRIKNTRVVLKDEDKKHSKKGSKKQKDSDVV